MKLNQESVPPDENSYLLVPFHVGGTVMVSARGAQQGFPVAVLSESRNIGRFVAGMRFRLSILKRNAAVFEAIDAPETTLVIACLATPSDERQAMLVTDEPDALGLTKHGLLSFGAEAEVIRVITSQKTKVLALRINIKASPQSDATLVFENVKGGSVSQRLPNRPDRRITGVTVPVRGIGRLDATENLGVGSLALVSVKSLTIGTSPEGKQLRTGFVERRGGFMISSNPKDQGAFTMLLSGDLPLDVLHALTTGYKTHRLEIQRESGDWEACPALIGLNHSLFTQTHSRGSVIGFRIRNIAVLNLSSAILSAAATFRLAELTRAKRLKLPVIRGMHTLRISPTDPDRVASIKISIGQHVFIINIQPFAQAWNSQHVPDGRHTIRIDLLDDTGALITTQHQDIYVNNNNLERDILGTRW